MITCHFECAGQTGGNEAADQPDPAGIGSANITAATFLSAAVTRARL